MTAKLTEQELSRRLQTIKKNGIVLKSQYLGMGKKHRFKCLVCGHKWMTTASNVLCKQQTGCPKCADARTSTRQTFPESEVRTRLKMLRIELLEAYTLARDAHRLRCLTCEQKWKTTINSIFSGHGCPRCARQRTEEKRRTPRSILEAKLHKLKLRLVTEFPKNCDIRSKFQCQVCQSIFTSSVYRVLRSKRGCPICAKAGTQYSKRYRKDLIKHLAKNHLTLEKGFSGYQNQALQCSNCGHNWKRTVALRLDIRCPVCHPHKFGASESKTISIIERETGRKFQRHAKPEWLKGRSNGNGMHLDGYCSKLVTKKWSGGVALEYQGEQHYAAFDCWGGEKAFLKRKRNDERKRLSCLRHSTLLIRVPYWKKNVEIFIRRKLRNAGFQY